MATVQGKGEPQEQHSLQQNADDGADFHAGPPRNLRNGREIPTDFEAAGAVRQPTPIRVPCTFMPTRSEMRDELGGRTSVLATAQIPSTCFVNHGLSDTSSL